MDIEDALKARRTIRLYKQEAVKDEDLRAMVDAARLTSCAANLQRLRFIIARTSKVVEDILENTAWAALVKPRRTPVFGETAPAAFIAITAPADASPILHADAGAAIQSMQLLAWNRGLGCCWIGSVNRETVKTILNVPADMQILYLLAVGIPAENPCSQDVRKGESIEYYLDDENRLHVPKLSVDDVSEWK